MPCSPHAWQRMTAWSRYRFASEEAAAAAYDLGALALNGFLAPTNFPPDMCAQLLHAPFCACPGYLTALVSVLTSIISHCMTLAKPCFARCCWASYAGGHREPEDTMNGRLAAACSCICTSEPPDQNLDLKLN